MSRLRLVGFAVFLALFVLASLPAAAQSTPHPAPLSPAQRGSIPASLRDDPRALEGGIALARVTNYGCNSGQLQFELAYLVPDAESEFVLRLTVRQGASVYMNRRQLLQQASGIISVTTTAETTGGGLSGTFPMTGNNTTTVAALLIDENSKPLWYTDATLDCDASPLTVTRRDGPVTILTNNPSFDTAGATAKTAADWSFTGKASRTCPFQTGDCAVKMKGKPTDEAQITQKAKHDGGFGAFDMHLGSLVIFDTDDADGSLQYLVEVRPSGGNKTLLTNQFIDVTGDATDQEIVTGLNGFFQTNGPINWTRARLSYLDSIDTGSVSIRAVYIWTFVP